MDSVPEREPIARDGRRFIWLCLLAIAIAAPPLWSGLKSADLTYHMEVISLLSSQEVWMRQADGEAGAWLLPSWNGRTRIEKPPFNIWVNLAAWRGLDPAATPAAELLFRARSAALLLVLASLAALAWTGWILGGPRLGVLAPAITGTMLSFFRHSRLASYDTYLMALIALSMAFGLWAVIRGPSRASWRSWAAWGFSGLALGCAVLSKGPLPLLFSGSIAIFILLRPDNKRRALAGWLFSVATAVIISAPWFLYVLDRVPETVQRLSHEYKAVQHNAQTRFYYFALFAWVFPWSLWLVPGVLLPVRRALASLREPIGAAWIWLVWMAVLLTFPDAKHQRYLTPALPAAGLLIGSAWLALTDSRLPRRWARALVSSHWIILGIGSFALLVMGLCQEQFLAWGWLRKPELVGIPLGAALCGTVAAFALVVWGRRQQLHGDALFSALATAAWMSLMAGVALPGYVRSYHGKFSSRAAAEEFGRSTRGVQVRHLFPTDGQTHIDEPSQQFLFYSQRIVPAVGVQGLASLADETDRILLVARENDDLDALARNAGWTQIGVLHDGSYSRRIYENQPREAGP